MEELVRKYQRIVRKKTRQYFLTLSPRKRAMLAGEIDEAEQAIRLLQHMGKNVPEYPEMGYHNKYETR